jgi:hypothetical protein
MTTWRWARFRGLNIVVATSALTTLVLAAALVGTVVPNSAKGASAVRAPRPTLSRAFVTASQRFGVPAPLLESLCYMEGRLSQHGGLPSADSGYGCMNLVHNGEADELDQAAKLLGTTATRLRDDIEENVLGGAAVLAATAKRISPRHTAPTSLSGWYGAIAEYSAASTLSVRTMYADEVYAIINRGFSARAQTGELITLAPQRVVPDRSTAADLPKPTRNLPSGCSSRSGGTDYRGAVNCVLPASTYDCNSVASGAKCTYQSADRPVDYPIDFVTIHDIEGTAQDAISIFQDPSSGVSVNYVVGGDGTIYEVVREKDIAYHAGNFFYNEHAIGIEHAGYDASGYQWYNATEYLASAKLVSYLLTKYHLPLDRAHILAHGTIPAPTVASSPNHVDPGPYWLWDYYFGLIHAQGIAYPTGTAPAGGFQLDPSTDQSPAGSGGTETSAQYNFFKLYTGPSTKDPVIPNYQCASDPTDETCDIEPGVTYYYLAHQPDAAGTGLRMYEIWYGENDHLADKPASWRADAKRAWVAVPSGAVRPAAAAVVRLAGPSSESVDVYGEPNDNPGYVIGDAPGGAQFSSPLTLNADGTTDRWYAIDYNHRQGWVPANSIDQVESATRH